LISCISTQANLDLYLDENFIVYPTTEDHDIFLTTRMTISQQILDNNCSLTDYNCSYDDLYNTTMYIADIENFILLIDHSLFADGLLHSNAAQLPGKLIDINNNVINFNGNSQIGIINKTDQLSVGLIMKAAGLDSLDLKSDIANATYRNYGLVFLMYISYSNVRTFDLNYIDYIITVRRADNTKYKGVQPTYTKDVQQRLLLDRHGIRLIVLQTGAIGQFDFPTLVLTIISGIGLFTIATTIVDFIATTLMPTKKLYSDFKYEETDDIIKEKKRRKLEKQYDRQLDTPLVEPIN